MYAGQFNKVVFEIILLLCISGPVCLKLTISLVNILDTKNATSLCQKFVRNLCSAKFLTIFWQKTNTATMVFLSTVKKIKFD